MKLRQGRELLEQLHHELACQLLELRYLRVLVQDVPQLNQDVVFVFPFDNGGIRETKLVLHQQTGPQKLPPLLLHEGRSEKADPLAAHEQILNLLLNRLPRLISL